ncbi:MAG: hydantoinase B/oxoprolinase family protein [bacterium]
MGNLKERLLARERNFAEKGSYADGFACKEADPIRYEIFHSRLLSSLVSARETAKRISASPMVREIGELCFTLYTPEGDSIVLSTGIMVHVHTMSRCIKWMILNDYEEKVGFDEGDYFSNNDSFIGGVHVPDIMTITPIRYAGELVGWAGGVTHVLEVGAVDAAGMGPSQTTRFHEGISLCCLKVAEQDRLRYDYEQMVLRNTRSPNYWLMDERARIAGCRIIRDSVKEILDRFGADYYRSATRELIEESRLGLKKKVRSVLFPGTYRGVAFYDVLLRGKPVPENASRDSLLHMPLEMRVTAGGDLSLSFDGASPWGQHNHNCSPAAMDGGMFVALTQFLAYDGKVNDGAWMACRLHLPKGSLFNPDSIFAATGAAWTTLLPAFGTFLRLLSRSFYAKGYREEILAGCANTNGQGGTGTDQYGNTFGTGNAELVCCGSGARGLMDGLDTAYALWNPESDMGDAEIWELILPVLHLGRKPTPDSGGFGKFRGGNGFSTVWLIHNTRDIQIITFANVTRVFDQSGIMGGYPSMCNYNYLARETNVKELIEGRKPLPHEEGDPGCPDMERLVKAGRFEVKEGAVFASRASAYDLFQHFYLAGGGYGDPIERDPALVLQDLENGMTTPRAAQDVYGVSIRPGSTEADPAGTAEKRRCVRQTRKERGVPAREYWRQQREKILRGELHPAVREMYRESFSLSADFAREFKEFWQLAADFSFA